MKIQALVIEPGFSKIDNIDGHLPHICREIEKVDDIIKGIDMGLRIVPSFAKALFIIDGMCFIAETQSVHLGKNSKGCGELHMSGRRINVMSVKPIKHGAAKRLLSLYKKRETERLAKILETTAEQLRLFVSSFE